MSLKFYYLVGLILVSTILAKGQNSVGIGVATPNSKAVLELVSPGNNQGFLTPRLNTAQRTNATFTSTLTATEKGLLVFDTDTGKFYYWSGAAWIVIEDSTGTDSQTLALSGKNLSITGGNTISLAAIDNQDLTLTGSTLSLTNDATTVSLATFLQNLSFTAAGTNRTINISGGTGITIDVADNDNSVTNEIQDLTLTGSTLSLSGDATTVSLAAFNQDLSLAGNILSLSGDASTVNLTPYLDNTDNQDLTLAGNVLSLTNDATTVSLATFLQNLTFTAAGTNRTINISGGTGITIDVADNDNSVTNEIQDLTLTGNTLSLSGDATTVSLAAYNQDLSLAGNILSLSGDASTVNLAPYLDNTDNQDLTLAGNVLSLTNDATTVSLASFLQNLTFTAAGTNRTINISGGTGITIDVADNDNSITNEIQTLSIAGSNLTLSAGGGTVTLPGGTTYTAGAGISIVGSVIANTGDLSATNEIQTLTTASPSATTRSVTISGGNTISFSIGDSDPNNEFQDLKSVLDRGNDAGAGSAVGFGAVSIGTNAAPGALNVDGSHFMGGTEFPSTADNYEVKPNDYIIYGRTTTAKPGNVVLPKASDNRGRVLIIRATGTSASSGLRIVSTDGLDGESGSNVMYFVDEANGPYYSMTVYCTGKDWISLNRAFTR